MSERNPIFSYFTSTSFFDSVHFKFVFFFAPMSGAEPRLGHENYSAEKGFSFSSFQSLDFLMFVLNLGFFYFLVFASLSVLEQNRREKKSANERLRFMHG